MNDTITSLYNEKRSKQVTPKTTVKRKIKKKDLPVLSIYEKELKYYEYDTIEDKKIYNGVHLESKEKLKSNINFFKMITPHTRFTKLTPSTLTVKGEFTNIHFNEEEYISKLEVPPIDFSSIVKIVCNFGEIYTFPNPFVNHTILSMVNSIESLYNV